MSETENVVTSPTTPAVRKGFLNSKSVAFVSIFSAIGAILSISTFAIPLGPNTALDLSHIGTYLVAIGGGPILGAIAGALGGIIPSMSPSISNIALVPGKMLTGFSVGIIYFLLKRKAFFQKNPKTKFLAMIIAGIVGYLPEMIFTIWDLYFIAFSLMPVELRISIMTGIFIKAWVEIIVISFLTTAIYSIRIIDEEVDRLVGKNASIGKIEYAASGIVISLSMIFVLAIYFPGLTRAQDIFIGLAIGLFILLGAFIVFIIIKMRQR